VRREIPDIGKVERVGWVSVSNGRSMVYCFIFLDFN
jgi:hypothetical protein